MEANLLWVYTQTLEDKLGGIEAKKGDNVGDGHAFRGRSRGGKVLSDGGVRGRVVLAEVE